MSLELSYIRLMLRRLLNITLNPFFQALVITVLAILFLPFGIEKYKAEQVMITTSFDQSKFVFSDLDHDGLSERIHTFVNESGNAGVVIRQKDIPDEQINFKGIYKDKSPRMMTGDYNRNGRDEVYLFTLVGDSIFLQAIEVGMGSTHFIRDRFLVRLGKNLADPDFFVAPGKVADMNGDRSGELIFAVNTGFSKYPRNVFLYDILNDSLMSSPRSGAYIREINLVNLDDDPYDEITLFTSATDNFMADPVPYSDSSSWMMVLDHDLTFLFPPVEFPGRTGNASVISLTNPKNGEPLLMCLVRYFKKEPAVEVFTADLKGNPIKVRSIPPEDPLSWMNVDPDMYSPEQGKTRFYVEMLGFFEIDLDLNIQQLSNAKFIRMPPDFIDIDRDGKDEIILLHPDQQKHQLYTSDFSDPVDLDLPIQSERPVFSVKLNGNDPPQLSVQGDNVWKVFDYGINPMYRYRALIYLAVYLFIFGFIFIIRNLYSLQLKRRYENEKKIAALQLAGIKAQMEPHFIFNVINSIGSSIYREQKEEAYELVLRFSNMVRSLLSSSDQLTRTLKEEIDFVSNFLELERSRFPELFTYSIHIDQQVDTESPTPKMIIQLHAENAIKHGIRPKGQNGSIEIRVVREDEYMLISIKDNGVGREAAGIRPTDSTGKGMKMLQQLFETYNKHNRLPLKQEVIDLFDDHKLPAGTLVKIWVPVNLNEKIY